MKEKIKKLEDENNETNNKTNKLKNEIKEIKEKLLPLKEEKDKEEKFDNFKESKIIKINDDKMLISNWIFPNSKIKFNLLYQISRDGDNISTFYDKVKNKCPTLIIVKSKSGYKFGGYTTNTWEQNGNYKKDELAFLFSLNKKKKYNNKNDHIQKAIYGCSYFFSFGDGIDLHISAQCISRSENYCNFSSYNTTEQYELNGGQQYFCVDELEVYHVEFE